MELSNFSFSSCEETYRNESYIGKIREWNRNPGQNVLLLLIEGCLVISVGFMGFLGNLFTISVLLRKEMRSSFSCLLIALAVCDALVTISGTFVHGFTGVSDYYPEYWSEYRKKFAAPLMVFFYPLRYAGHTGSVYFVLAISLERLLCVKYPLKARRWCSYARARKLSLGIITFAILYNIPRWWEVESRCVWWPDDQEYILRIRFLNEFNSLHTQLYIHIMSFVFIQGIPFFTLVLVNIITYREVRMADENRALLSLSQTKDHNLARMFITIVVIFLCCNIPFIAAYIWKALVRERSDLQVDSLWYFHNLLVILNSAVNFMVYCLYGAKFRRIVSEQLGIYRLRRFSSTLFEKMGRSRRTSKVTELERQSDLPPFDIYKGYADSDEFCFHNQDKVVYM